MFSARCCTPVASDEGMFCSTCDAGIPPDLLDASVAVLGVVRDLLVGEGLVRVLGAYPGLQFASLRPDEAQLLQAIIDADPDVVIIDVGISPSAKAGNVELAVELSRLSSTIGLLALSIEPDLDVARSLLEHGVAHRGYLLHDRLQEPKQLATAIRDVAAGGSAIDERVLAALLRQRKFEESSPISELTARQAEVLSEVARGKSNRAIAEIFGITKKSVEHHIAAIFNRLDLSDEKDVSRRVAATLLHLRATLTHGSPAAPSRRPSPPPTHDSRSSKVGSEARSPIAAPAA